MPGIATVAGLELLVLAPAAAALSRLMMERLALESTGRGRLWMFPHSRSIMRVFLTKVNILQRI